VQVIFGFLVGDYIRRQGIYVQETGLNKSPVNPIYQTLTILLMAAVALLFTGYVWDFSFPINKKIWTSSYVVYTSGLAILVLCTLIFFIEVRKATGWWSRFFDVFGKNPLFIYALSGLIPELLSLIHIPAGTNEAGETIYTNPWTWFYQNITAKIPGPPENGSLLFALAFVTLLWAIGYWMDKKKVYVRV
jgi:predicted acyltransferase